MGDHYSEYRDNVHLNPDPVRPLEPRRSRLYSGPAGPRASTATWISSSQFAQQRPPPPPAGPIQIPSPASTARGFPRDEGSAYTPYAPSVAPSADAEQMTVDMGAGGYDPEAVDGLDPAKRRGSISGFLRRIPKIRIRSRSSVGESMAYDPGAEPRDSFPPRDVTYVDTNTPIDGASLAPGGVYFPPRDSALASIDEHGDSDPTTLRAESVHTVHDREPQDPEMVRAESRSRSHSGDSTLAHPENEAGAGGEQADGTTAVHHGPTFIEPTQSEFEKMSNSYFHTAPSELNSITSYVDRVQQFFRDLNDLPWMSSRVAVDYIPGESSRSKYYRYKQRHQNGVASLGLNSWYALPAHEDVDLLEGETSPRRRPTVPTGPLFNGADYIYPSPYPYAPGEGPAGPGGYGFPVYPAGMYTRSEGSAGGGGPPIFPTPRSPASHGSSPLSQRTHTHAGTASVGYGSPAPLVSWASPGTDRTIPTLSRSRTPGTYEDTITLRATSPTPMTPTMHAMPGQFEGPDRSQSQNQPQERTQDRTQSPSQGQGQGRPPPTRWYTAGSATSRPSDRDRDRDRERGNTGPEPVGEEHVDAHGRRRSRKSWYSSDGGTPTMQPQPLYVYASHSPPPMSPPRSEGGMSGGGGGGSGGRGPGSGSGSVQSGSGGRSWGSRSGRSPEMAQAQPQIYLVPVNQPASPPRSAAGPRRNRWEHQYAYNPTPPSAMPFVPVTRAR